MITIIGLGPGDADGLSRGAERSLRDASISMKAGSGILLLRTARHPLIDTLRQWNLSFETFDALYDRAPDFQTVYEGIVSTLVDYAQSAACGEFDVAYAVPGHPLLGEESVRALIETAHVAGLSYRVVSSGSFVEAALTAVGVPLTDGCDVRDALTLGLHDKVDACGNPCGSRLDTQRALLLFQVFDAASASYAKLCLMRDYPDDWTVSVVRWAGIHGREEVQSVPLYRLDRVPFDDLTAVFVPPLSPALRPKSFVTLAGVMARLRAPDGCPWDREQTHTTLKRYLIEETYEVIETIDNDDVDALCEELGDVLLQVVFHAQLAAEQGLFTIDDVTAGIVTKLIRRHPHVFGTVSVKDSDEVLANWNLIKQEEKVKQEEKAGFEPGAKKSVLDGVPRGLPALMRALEISKRAVSVGFEWQTLADVLMKLEEELVELRAELDISAPDRERVMSELGDLLFTVVQVARWQKIDPEEALQAMLMQFKDRFAYIEAAAAEQHRNLGNLTLDEMDALWHEAKQNEFIGRHAQDR